MFEAEYPPKATRRLLQERRQVSDWASFPVLVSLDRLGLNVGLADGAVVIVVVYVVLFRYSRVTV